MQSKKFDLIVCGATGFTGQLVVEYLWKEYNNSNFKWAIAGRDANKLEQVGMKFSLQNISYLVADSSDLISLKQLARQAKAVNTVI